MEKTMMQIDLKYESPANEKYCYKLKKAMMSPLHSLQSEFGRSRYNYY